MTAPLDALITVLAVAVVWPFLFAVPGWLLVARVAPDLSAAGRTEIGRAHV